MSLQLLFRPGFGGKSCSSGKYWNVDIILTATEGSWEPIESQREASKEERLAVPDLRRARHHPRAGLEVAPCGSGLVTTGQGGPFFLSCLEDRTPGCGSVICVSSNPEAQVQELGIEFILEAVQLVPSRGQILSFLGDRVSKRKRTRGGSYSYVYIIYMVYIHTCVYIYT